MEDPTYLLAMLVGGFVLVVLVAIVGGFLHSRRCRLLTHAERMKALELGREWPVDEATARLKAVIGSSVETEDAPEKSIAVQMYTTTGWVSGLGLLFAAWASGISAGSGVPYAIAASAGAIGVTGMICGTILALKSPTPTPAPAPTFSLAKPRLDPDEI